MRPPVGLKNTRPVTIEGAILLSVRILENARKESEQMRTEWYRSKDCQDILDLTGIKKTLYREILELPESADKGII